MRVEYKNLKAGLYSWVKVIECGGWRENFVDGFIPLRSGIVIDCCVIYRKGTILVF